VCGVVFTRFLFIYFNIALFGLTVFAAPISSTTSAEKNCCVCIFDDQWKYIVTAQYAIQCGYWFKHRADNNPRLSSCTLLAMRGLTGSAPKLEDPIPTDCTALDIAYRGDGAQRGEYIPNQIAPYLAHNSTIKKLDYDSNGCSVFRSMAGANRQAVAIQALLPAGCIARITANQSDVIDIRKTGVPLNPTPLRFLISTTAITELYSSCNAVGSECNAASINPHFICTSPKTGQVVTQDCCGTPSGSQWIEPETTCDSAQKTVKK